MPRHFLVVAIAAVSMVVASQARSDTAAAMCSALVRADFAGVIDAPTQVTGARVVKSDDVPEFCEVTGYIEPSVGFLLALPVQTWNGKFLEQGCGGFCGGGPIEAARKNPGALSSSLERGYAVMMFDG